jgi:DNA-binding CsgD family transcriptional regulator
MMKLKPTSGRLALPMDARNAVLFAHVIEAIGQADFGKRLHALMLCWLDFDSFGILEFHPHQPPRQRYHSLDATLSRVNDSVYFVGAYALDPFYQLHLAESPDGVYRLADIAADGFEISEYFRRFHHPSGAGDELNFLVRGGDGTTTTVFLERLATNEAFDAGDLATAALICPLVLALVKQNRHQGAVAEILSEDAITHARVSSALRNFGRSCLTAREREVLIYALRGYSAGLTAERLQVSEGTVKNHRKSIYRKLDVSSQSELFSLFINTIPFAGADARDEADPLSVYERPATKGR